MAPRRQFLNDSGTLVAQALEGLERAHPGNRALEPRSELHHPRRRRPSRAGRGDLGRRLGPRAAAHRFRRSRHARCGSARRDLREPVDDPGRARRPTRPHHGRGVVHIVKNYTGDVINFGLARDDAIEEGIAVESVIVADDLATDDAGGGGPGRPRRTAAVIAVEKICGAAAERGDDLAAVARARQPGRGRRRARWRSPSRRGTHPGAEGPSFELGRDEIEFGVGIHGERGIDRRAFAPAAELAELLVDAGRARARARRAATR